MISSCAPQGACTQQVDLNTASLNRCYSNGVKVVGGASGTQFFANGSPCYGIGINTAGGVTTMVYKSPSGVTLVTTSVSALTSNEMYVVCPGWSQTIDLTACGMGNMSNPQQCSSGSCP